MNRRRALALSTVAIGITVIRCAALSASLPQQQQAIVQTGAGGPEVLQLETLPVLEPGSGQVLVRVYAASVNPADWSQLEHVPATGNSARRVPGLDVSGVIAAVGPGVTDRPLGMPVFGMVDHTAESLNGGYAQYSLANASSTAPKPANLSYAEAAGLGVVGVTALRALDDGNLQAGQRVLITGVAGGVGSTAAQIAVARGVIVLGTASPRHDAYLRSIGVHQLIDYTLGDIAAHAGPTDAVVDTVGGSEALDAFRSLKPGGRFVSIAHAGVTPEQCAAAKVQCFGSPGPAAAAPQAVLLQIAQLAGAGKLTAHVDQAFPLEHAVEALQYVHQGHTEGKVILAVTSEAAGR